MEARRLGQWVTGLPGSVPMPKPASQRRMHTRGGFHHLYFSLISPPCRHSLTMHNSSQCAVETAKDLRKLAGWLLKGRGWVTPVQKSRCTLCTIPYCLGSQWIREEQAARRPRHPTSPRPSNVDTCNFMDCLGIQFNSEFHNMKVNPWCFTIILYRECSFSSFYFFFFSAGGQSVL